MKTTSLPYVALLPCVLGLAEMRAEEPVRLREALPIGSRYRVQIRVQLQGKLTVPAEKGKPEPKPLPLTGESAIDYDERVLSLDREGKVNRTVRIVRRIDFERELGSTSQKATLRPAVRRIVQVRMNNTEVPFSPDGPLTWGEIDLLRTDVFTPALLGLLTEREVRVGDRWKASLDAVRELTDFEQVDEGGLECRLERIVVVDRRRQARVSLTGTVRGTNEDGQARQQLDGLLTFDLDGAYLSSLTINGKHTLLNGGKEVGKVEGRFVMTRQPDPRAAELTDEALRGVALEPNDSNTRLMYENDDLKVSFLYPRRWRVSSVQGRQITLDTADGGNGLLMTIDPPQRVPTGDQFLAETRTWLEKQKARVVRIVPPHRTQAAPLSVERFAIEAEMAGQKFVMDYHIARQAAGGATIAARLQPANVATAQKEVADIARSVRLR